MIDERKCRGARKRVVLIGTGMVGLRFCEKLIEFDKPRDYEIVTFCEEPRAAYDRVGLTSFFAHRDAERLMLARMEWYQDNGIDLHVGDRVAAIDRQAKIVRSGKGVEIGYDTVILATGSIPFVPPVPGIEQAGVFVYRTIEDLERIIEYGSRARRAAVIGGGLLGLEAARAAYDLGLETHVVEFAPRLMPRQVDDTGSRVLADKIRSLGVHVHLGKVTEEVLGEGEVTGLRFKDGEQLDVDMLIVSAGIRPRDEVARECGLSIGERGGVVVDDHLRTSDPDIYAVGEVALHSGMIYGLVAPGYEMAGVVAANLCGEERCFGGADLSTKLKLMGVDVANFGDHEAADDVATALRREDPIAGTYKKLLVSKDGGCLLGGILVGDASDFGSLLMLTKSGKPLPCSPGELLGGSATAPMLGSVSAMADDTRVCSCNGVTKGTIAAAVREHGLESLAAVKSHTRATSGCGGCAPLVAQILDAEMKSAGKQRTNHMCEHFPYSRTELFAIIRVKELKTFECIISEYGRGNGCEICKPAVTSILAALWNEHILDPGHQTLQDTNDRFLANVQRGGLYSVIPRVPAGEITPEKLITLGTVAKKFGLYTKITGAQRVDLLGAKVQDLPGIWEELVDAGFESGHAYGKALRTVKSCVGTTWCRYGVQDSVGFAVKVENRYKGIRSPHKVKSAVSGCVRECAEAQSKDFGLVATEKGYNLYVCGNGGAKPRHADLLAADVDEETAIRYIDRFMMYYVMTADKLTRTAVWIDNLEGGIEHLREVIVEDKLGIAVELEERMQYLVDTYRCEWAEAVRNPERRKWFRQFVNTEEEESSIEIVHERGQSRPADWPSEAVSIEQTKAWNGNGRIHGSGRRWAKVGLVSDFPRDGGSTVKYGKVQIAVFNFSSRGSWYACQQMCPHRKAFVLSRGIVGDQAGEPKVACPLHKKAFSLESGNCLSGESYTVEVFPVDVRGEDVYLHLPPESELDSRLATAIGRSLATPCAARSCPPANGNGQRELPVSLEADAVESPLHRGEGRGERLP